MDFIISSQKNYSFENHVLIDNSLFLSYNVNHKVRNRELIHETPDILIIVDANLYFVNSLNDNNITRFSIEKNIDKLQNGFAIYIDKKQNSITIYNDIFGFCHLYSRVKDNQVILTNNYNQLLAFSEKKIDSLAVLDLFFFNYTLLDRTIISDIKRLPGGSKVVISNQKVTQNTLFNFAKNFKPADISTPVSPDVFGNILSGSIKNELSCEHEVLLTMTAGFDSRALMAACNSLQLNFSSFTFGQQGNIEIETIRPFINNYSKNHTFFNLDSSYTQTIEKTLNQFIGNVIDNPTILDLPHYFYIKNQLEASNLITGFMGGELMLGQSIGAGVILTAHAAQLLTSDNPDDLKKHFKEAAAKHGLFNDDILNKIEAEYIDSLQEYFAGKENLNLLTFLINEKYAKFFGTINKVFRNHSNLIVPFMNKELIEYLLNSDVSFLNKVPFKNNPLTNFKGKTFYAKAIKALSPELGKTKFDRLYSINDLCSPFNYPKAALGYFQSHFLKKNKKHPRPHHYDLWFRDIVIKTLNRTEKIASGFNSEFSLSVEKYESLSSPDKKALANVTASVIAFEQILQVED